MNDEKDPQGNPWIKSAMIWAGVIIALLLFVSLFERPTTQAGSADPLRVQPIFCQQPTYHRREQTHPGSSSCPPTGHPCTYHLGAAAISRCRWHAGRRRSASCVSRCVAGDGGRSRQRRGGRRTVGVYSTEEGSNGDGGPFGGDDLDQHTTQRRRHLGIDLLGRDLVERSVGRHRLAHSEEPARDGALGDRLAELREEDVGHRISRAAPGR